jgi:hypothetical protein
MTKEELKKSIYEAFKDVKLEDGIGLWEARMIDDWHDKSEPEYIRVRNTDERDDWKKLLPTFLDQTKPENYVGDIWSFMDAKGIRFHLPCFILQDIDIPTLDDNPLIFTLQKTASKESFDRLKILNAAQKKVINEYLEYRIEQDKIQNNYFSLEEDQRAKENFEKYIINENN